MGLETGSYINSLEPTNPLGTDPKSAGDDHIRLIKSTIKNTFPSVTGAVTATHTELNYSDGVTSAIQTQLDSKQPNVTGAATTITDTNLTASRALVANSSGKVAVSVTTLAELAFLSGVTSNLQAQIDALDDRFYPVGSIYANATSGTNPATLLGFGTWTAFGAGRVMVGRDAADTSFDVVGETGGSKNAINVAHTHSVTATTSGQSATHYHTGATTYDGAHTHSTNGQVQGYFYYSGGGGSAGVGVPYEADGITGSSGAHTHTLTTNANIGDHTHTVSTTTASSGASGTNANLPPYIVVYLWKRTA